MEMWRAGGTEETLGYFFLDRVLLGWEDERKGLKEVGSYGHRRLIVGAFRGCNLRRGTLLPYPKVCILLELSTLKNRIARKEHANGFLRSKTMADGIPRLPDRKE